jgi:hypothetical protein
VRQALDNIRVPSNRQGTILGAITTMSRFFTGANPPDAVA